MADSMGPNSGGVDWTYWGVLGIANAAGLLARSKHWVREKRWDRQRIWADLSTTGVMTLGAVALGGLLNLSTLAVAGIVAVSVSMGFEPFRDMVLSIMKKVPDAVEGRIRGSSVAQEEAPPPAQDEDAPPVEPKP